MLVLLCVINDVMVTSSPGDMTCHVSDEEPAITGELGDQDVAGGAHQRVVGEVGVEQRGQSPASGLHLQGVWPESI